MDDKIYHGLMKPPEKVEQGYQVQMKYIGNGQGYQAKSAMPPISTQEHHMARELYQHAAMMYVNCKRYGDKGTDEGWFELCCSLSRCFPGIEQ